MESAGEYAVQSALCSRKIGDTTEVAVQWEGYGKSGTTWEPMHHMDGAPEAIAELHRLQQSRGNFASVGGMGEHLWMPPLPEILYRDFVCMNPGTKLSKQLRRKIEECSKVPRLPKAGVSMALQNEWYLLADDEPGMLKGLLAETVGITASVEGVLIMMQHNSAGDHVVIHIRFLMRDLTLLDGSGLAVFEVGYSTKASRPLLVLCKSLLGNHDRIGVIQSLDVPDALTSWYRELTRIISCRAKAGLPKGACDLSTVASFANSDIISGDVGLSDLIGVDVAGDKVYRSCTVMSSDESTIEFQSGCDAFVLTKEHGEELARLLCFVELGGTQFAVVRWWCIQKAVLKSHQEQMIELRCEPNELFFCNEMRLIPTKTLDSVVPFQVQYGDSAEGDDYFYRRMYVSTAKDPMNAFVNLPANSEKERSTDLSPAKPPPKHCQHGEADPPRCL